ncbi:MAG: YfhO family protein [Proteobacteria bacterium]|nr:YfhO family protein [Pseudomonadota bacterium]
MGNNLQDKVLFFSDIALQYYPWKQFLVEQFKSFSLPLWCPNIFCGFPLLAEGQTGTFYPLNVIFLLLPFPSAFNCYVMIHFFLMGIFTYAYCRLIGLSLYPSLIAGITCSYSGFMTVHTVHVSMITCAAYLPLGFYLIEKASFRDPLYYLLCLAFVICIQSFAGHPQILAISLIAYFSYYLFRATTKDAAPFPNRWLTCALFILPVAFGLTMAFIQLLPTYELSFSTGRSEISREFMISYSLPPWHVITYLFPDFFGWQSPYQPGNFWETGGNYLEFTCYAGIAGLILTLFSFGFSRRRREVIFFFMLFFTALILALGKFTPVYGWLTSLIPFYKFRCPSRFLLLSTFAFSILAGFGAENLINRDTERAKRFVACCQVFLFATLLGCLILHLLFHWSVMEHAIQPFILKFTGWMQPLSHAASNTSYSAIVENKLVHLKETLDLRSTTLLKPLLLLSILTLLLTLYARSKLPKLLFKVMLLLFIVGDLFIFSWRYNHGESVPEVLKPPGVLQSFKHDSRLFRTFTLYGSGELAVQKATLLPNLNILWGIDSIWGYSPLEFKRHSEIMKALPPVLLNMMNMRYVLSVPGEDSFGMKEVRRDKHSVLFELADYLPRAFLVNNYRVLNPETMKNEMLHGRVDFSRIALLEKDPNIRLIGGVTQGKIAFQDYRDENIVMHVSSESDALLILSDSYYPGWHAWIDGKETEIYRANYLFRGIVVTKGEHLITFSYQPAILKTGLIVSLLSFSIWAIGLLITFLYRKRSKMFLTKSESYTV